MDSTHQELYFLLLSASQLSKRSSGGLGEVKKTVDGNTKIAFPEIYPAGRPPAPPATAAGTLRTQNLGDIPATAAQSPLQPRPQLIVWKFQSVNNRGDESNFFACSSIESIIYQWDVLGWVIAEHEETDKRKLE